MYKTLITGSLLGLGMIGPQTSAQRQLILQLKEEATTIRYNATADEAALFVEAESEEPLDSVGIQDPRGTSILELQRGHGPHLALSGFVVETEETSYAALAAAYPEGLYRMSARTHAGQLAVGQAALSHRLPPAPRVTYPLDGAVGVPLDVTITWNHDPHAVAYRVGLEQEENDGLSAQLSAGAHSFRVPQGVLLAGKTTHLEVAAIGQNGNRTLVELNFETQ